ncbi:MAG TPA: protoporphyrinogen oxidase [bacterium]|nr:protoporphyrinogen oxidase [bacterium]
MIPRRPRVAVIGGGITGLAAARVLRDARLRGEIGEVLLIEASPRLGGKILTERVGDFLIEGGPDSFLTVKPHAVELARAVGLGDRLIGTLEPRDVFILHRGRLHPLPDGLAALIPRRLAPFLRSTLFTLAEKARFGLEPFVPPSRDGDESLGAFVRRRLGRAAVERLAGPLLAGIHAADAEELSLQATFPALAEAERRYGSLTRAALAGRRRPHRADAGPMFMTLRGGLQELVTAAAHLPEVRVLTETPVRAIERAADGYVLRLDGGVSERVERLVLAVPAPAAGALLAGINPEAARWASMIPHVSTAVVAFGFRRADVRHPLVGHGYLVGLGEGLRHTATTWVSSKWPARAPDGHVLLRCFTGRAGDPGALPLDDERLARALLDELRPLLCITGTPVLTRVYRWPQAMPQYTRGHLDRLQALRRALAATPGIVAAGGAYGGVGLPDCIRQGMEAGEAILGRAPSSPRPVEVTR